jgi:hypothetical protein
VVLVEDGSLISINRHFTNHNKSRGKCSTAFLLIPGKLYLIKKVKKFVKQGPDPDFFQLLNNQTTFPCSIAIDLLSTGVKQEPGFYV